ncbi:hypothetical protein QUF80_21545 [Desulfococcaceae bacterium HSG8]|nr:hypothetical protein [Desulfococcaceae bacterium HSG8]
MSENSKYGRYADVYLKDTTNRLSLAEVKVFKNSTRLREPLHSIRRILIMMLPS